MRQLEGPDGERVDVVIHESKSYRTQGGEAANIRETIQKTAELHPDLIIRDVTMPEKDCIAPTKVKDLLNGAKILAITLGADEVKEELLHGIGAAKLLDKMDLSDQLIPAILEFAPAKTMQPV